MTHPIAFNASRIDCVSSENLTMSTAVVGPIVGKLKGTSSALEEYLENKSNVNVALPLLQCATQRSLFEDVHNSS